MKSLRVPRNLEQIGAGSEHDFYFIPSYSAFGTMLA